jgi:hypothetical protein
VRLHHSKFCCRICTDSELLTNVALVYNKRLKIPICTTCGLLVEKNSAHAHVKKNHTTRYTKKTLPTKEKLVEEIEKIEKENEVDSDIDIKKLDTMKTWRSVKGLPYYLRYCCPHCTFNPNTSERFIRSDKYTVSRHMREQCSEREATTNNNGVQQQQAEPREVVVQKLSNNVGKYKYIVCDGTYPTLNNFD